MANEAASFVTTVTTRLNLNGAIVAVTHEARVSLLDLLRERLQMTGTKKGCNEGACGACTVQVDGKRVNGCMTLAASCDGKDVTTVEGLAASPKLVSRPHRRNCAIARRSAATFSRRRAALIFAPRLRARTRCRGRATSASQAPDARPSRVDIRASRCSVGTSNASQRSRGTPPWRWRRSTLRSKCGRSTAIERFR